MKWLINFYKTHTGVSHTIAFVVLILIGAYNQVPQFHDLVNYYFGLCPQSVKQIIISTIAVMVWYTNTWNKPNVNN